jgi:hypothetical protein
LKDRVREERLKLFRTSEENMSDEGFIKINAKTDGRIYNVSEPILDFLRNSSSNESMSPLKDSID